MASLSDLQLLYPWLIRLGRILIIFAAAGLGALLLRRLIRRIRLATVKVMMRHAGGTSLELEKRAATIAGVMRKAAIVLIWALAIVMALREVGFDIGPILAGAGVVGLAIGFGAQNLVRDVISGFFMLLENQIRVNDVVIINGTGGLVEEINLRTTVLRGLDGVVHIFPNGSITTLSNMTRDYSYYVFDIGIAYKEDTDRVVTVLKDVAEGMKAEEPYNTLMLDALEVLGVDRFTDSAVVIKARIKTQPMQQWLVGREMNRRIKKRFDELGIEIPFPHTSLYFGGASKPIRVHLDGLEPDTLKEAIRGVMQELKADGTAAGGTQGRSGNESR